MYSEKLPVFIANFVLMEYGTGAIFGSAGHDQRDLDFARAFDLPVRARMTAVAGRDDAKVRAAAAHGVLAVAAAGAGLPLEEICRRCDDALVELVSLDR